MIKGRYEYIVVTFFLTLILANNKAPIFNSYENLRVVYVLAMAGLSLFVIFREKGLDGRVLYFFPFLISALISSWLFSPVVSNSIFKVLSYLLLVIALFELVRFVFQHEEFQLYEHLILLVGITVLISLLGRFLYPSVFVIAGRLNGVMGNPNFMGLYCVLAYPLIDHFKFKESVFSEKSILVLKYLLIICLLLTGSRNGYASFILYLMLTFFLFRGFSGKTLATLVGLGSLFVFFQIEALVDFVPLLSEFIRPETLETASGRSVVWPVAIEEIFRQPWLGGGFEYYSYYMANFANTHGLEGVYWYGVWNSYLALLLDTGIVGLCAYTFFIYGVIKTCKNHIILLPFLGTILFTAFFEAWVVSSLNPITPFFLLFFLTISIYGSRYEDISTA